MNRPSSVAAIAALSLISALPFVAAPAAATVELPRFFVNVERSRVSDDVIQKIRPGQTQEDITALIGAPQHTVKFPRSRTIAWDYDYRDAWGYESRFSVIFDEDGTVQSKFSVRHQS